MAKKEKKKKSDNPEYFGKYILHESFAAGGMAEVFLCRSPGAGVAGKFCAMKRILPQFSNNKDFIRMFKDEAKIALNLSHSNIVSIYEFGIEQDQLFLVMELVEGKNLRQILNKLGKSDKQLQVEHVLHIINQLCIGLDHAHKCLDGSTGRPLNIIHRDISPQNVMISYNGEVKIIDFGIAKAESQIEATKAGTLKGKFGYMSPEQVEGLEIDIRTDVFSVGIMLWEMIANERLFIANNEINTLKKIKECSVPSLSKFNPNISDELEQIVFKALHKDRNLRYQTAGALSRDLTLFLNRHYPEFLPTDFADFIKSIYGSDIQEFRDKLITYTKVQWQDPNSDKTDVISSKTKTQKRKSIDLSSNDFDFDGAPTPPPMPGRSKKEAQDNINAFDNRTTIDDEYLDQAENPKYGIPVNHHSNNQNPYLEETDYPTFSSDYSHYKGEKHTSEDSQSDFITSSYNGPPLEDFKRKKRKVLFFQLSILVFISSGIFFFFSDYINQTSQPPIVEKTSQPSKDPSGASGVEPTNVQEPKKPIDLKEEKKPRGVVVSGPLPDEITKKNVLIQSLPSGAEIYINGLNTGFTTPAMVEVPEKESFTLNLKRNNYITYERKGLTRKEILKNKFTATLFEAQVASLSIDVIPSRNARIYINGQLLHEGRIPIKNYKIPADTRIIIKAENPFTKKVDIKTVKLRKNARKNILLRLK